MNVLSFSKKDDLFTFVKKNGSYRYVIVMFAAKWCSACKKMLEVFEQLLKKREEGDVLFFQLDTEKNLTLSRDPFFAVSTIPKTFIFQKGIFWKILEGSTSLRDLEEFLRS